MTFTVFCTVPSPAEEMHKQPLPGVCKAIMEDLRAGKIGDSAVSPGWNLTPWELKITANGELHGIRGPQLRGDGRTVAWKGKIVFKPQMKIIWPEETNFPGEYRVSKVICGADEIGNHTQIDLIFYTETIRFDLVTSAEKILPYECYKFEPSKGLVEACPPLPK